MEEPGSGRKRRPMRRFGESLDPQRPTDPYLLVKNEPGELAHPVKLAGAAGQHHTAPRELVRTAGFEAVAHHFEGLLDARCDDADEHRFRHMLGVPVFLLADLRYRDQFALIE